LNIRVLRSLFVCLSRVVNWYRPSGVYGVFLLYFQRMAAIPSKSPLALGRSTASSTPVDFTMIPTGEIVTVPGTDLDFTTPHTLGERINSDNQQLRFGNGYDFNYVINKEGDEPGFAATGNRKAVILWKYSLQNRECSFIVGISFQNRRSAIAENRMEGVQDSVSKHNIFLTARTNRNSRQPSWNQAMCSNRQPFINSQ